MTPTMTLPPLLSAVLALPLPTLATITVLDPSLLDVYACPTLLCSALLAVLAGLGVGRA